MRKKKKQIRYDIINNGEVLIKNISYALCQHLRKHDNNFIKGDFVKTISKEAKNIFNFNYGKRVKKS
jgi:hypothetical protein